MTARGRAHGRARGAGGLPPAVLALLLAFSVALLACGAAPVVPHDPTIVGVVTERTFVGPSTVRLMLATGARIEIDLEAVDSLDRSVPDIGDLLLYGVDDDGPWYVAVPHTYGRFELRTQPALIRSRTALFDFGLRLPLASNYRQAEYGRLEPGAPFPYLISETGEVLEGRRRVGSRIAPPSSGTALRSPATTSSTGTRSTPTHRRNRS